MKSDNSANKEQIIEQLRAENELKTKWLSLIAHDFKGLFSNIQLLLDGYANKSIPQEVFVSMLPELKEHAQKNQKTLHTTIAWVKAQKDGFHPHLETINIYNLYQAVVEELSDETATKEVAVSFVGNKELTLNTDPFLLKFIIKQLLQNSIKYSKQGGLVEFAVVSNSLNSIITITDSGVGMKSSQIATIGTLNGTPYTGTMGEGGAGLSLVVVNDFVAMLNGTMDISTLQEKGTKVQLILP